MANEFVARNGLIAQNNSAITGSLAQGAAGNITSGSYSHAEGGNGVTIDPSQPPISLSDINYIVIAGAYGYDVNLGNVTPTAILLDGDQTGVVPPTAFSLYPLTISTDGGVVYSFTVNPQYYDTVPIITTKGYNEEDDQTILTIDPPLQSIYYAVTSDDRNKALGDGSHAEGLGTIAQGDFQHVQGKYNKTSTVQSAFIHGNGTSGAARSNLIYAHDSVVEITGSLRVSGSITGSLFGTASNALTASYVTGSIFTSINPALSASFALSSSRAISSSYAVTASYLTGYVSPFPFSGSAVITGSLLISGSGLTVTGPVKVTGSLVQGTPGNIASGSNSHAEGGGGSSDTSINLNDVTSMIVNGVSLINPLPTPSYFRSDGNLESSFPPGSFTITSLTLTSGATSITPDLSQYPTAVVSFYAYDGEGNTDFYLASSPLQQSYSEVIDASNKALGTGSHAEGIGTIAKGDFQHVQGQYNITSSAQSAFIHGNGTSDTSRSNLIFASGSQVQISGSLKVSGSIDVSGGQVNVNGVNILDTALAYSIALG